MLKPTPIIKLMAALVLAVGAATLLTSNDPRFRQLASLAMLPGIRLSGMVIAPRTGSLAWQLFGIEDL